MALALHNQPYVRVNQIWMTGTTRHLYNIMPSLRKILATHDISPLFHQILTTNDITSSLHKILVTSGTMFSLLKTVMMRLLQNFDDGTYEQYYIGCSEKLRWRSCTPRLQWCCERGKKRSCPIKLGQDCTQLAILQWPHPINTKHEITWTDVALSAPQEAETEPSKNRWEQQHTLSTQARKGSQQCTKHLHK